MKIAIVSIVNIKHMSLISLYTDIFDKKNIKYDLVYIDKYNVYEKNNANNIYKYILDIERTDSKIKKIKKYLGFRKYVKNVISKNKYDLLIIWKTETALLLFDLLLFKFSNQYILNIRDYFNEKFKVIYLLENIIVQNSIYTTVSSKKFLEFLPPSDRYIYVNSLNPYIYEASKKQRQIFKVDKTIRLCFIGYVRFYEEDKKLLRALKNDERFVVQYFGSGSEVLESYAKENSIGNVEFISGFDSAETLKLLKKANVINNLYGNKNIALDTAISIKYYYSIFFKMPLLVYKNTYMEEITRDTGHAFIFDGNYENLAERIYDWYINLNEENINNNLNNKLEKIKKENLLFYNKLVTVINKEVNK